MMQLCCNKVHACLFMGSSTYNPQDGTVLFPLPVFFFFKLAVETGNA